MDARLEKALTGLVLAKMAMDNAATYMDQLLARESTQAERTVGDRLVKATRENFIAAGRDVVFSLGSASEVAVGL